MNKNIILKIKGIEKSFSGVKVLNNINLEIIKGEIHAIVGENGAGKSTLMKIISGEYYPTKGEMYIEGRKRKNYSPSEALKEGIILVHQEFSLVPQLSVFENIFLGRWNYESNKHYLIDKKNLKDKATKIFKSMGIEHISLEVKVSSLSTGDKQLVEIAKALSYEPKILILDEPTAALSIEETNSLFQILKNLKAKGVTILYISHRLEEIYQIAEKVSVLRNGELVYSGPISNVDINKLISLMIGREVTNKYPEKPDKNIGEIIFKVENLSSDNFYNISFELHKGEILGITGLVGCGSTQLGEALFGLGKFYRGNIYYKGSKFYPKKPKDSISKNICYIPGDRQSLGLVLRRSVVENHTLPNMDIFAKSIFVNTQKEKQSAISTIEQLNIKVHNIKENVEKLSGGNQQKLVIGKWLIRQPEVLIMDEPTRGVDVGAKYEIYKEIYKLSTQGVSILLISSDIDEVYNLCDRVLVMSNGHITKSVYPETSSKEEMLLFAVQGKEKVR